MTAQPGEITRNAYMDFLKGIAMIAVIVGHSLSGIRSMDLLFNVIYSFHMPLLFFVSACIEELNRERYAGNEGRMLIKRAGGLLLPYLSWSIIYTAVFAGELRNGLWFFPVLFGLKMMHTLYWIICRKTGKETLVTDLLILAGLETVCALLAVLTRQPYLINMLSYAIPYFTAVVIVKHEEIQKIVNSEWLTAGAILSYALVFPYFSFYDTGWTTQVFRIGLSLCVIVVCCRLNVQKSQPNENRLYQMVCVCGENSLAVYVLHGFLMDYKEYFDVIDSAVLVGLMSVVMACAVAAVCIAAAKVIGISSWWKKILFGR